MLSVVKTSGSTYENLAQGKTSIGVDSVVLKPWIGPQNNLYFSIGSYSLVAGEIVFSLELQLEKTFLTREHLTGAFRRVVSLWWLWASWGCKGGCNASAEMGLQISVEFVSGAVFQSGVDRQDAGAFVLKKRLIFEPIHERVSISPATAVTVVSTQCHCLSLDLKTRTESKTQAARWHMCFGSDYIVRNSH